MCEIEISSNYNGKDYGNPVMVCENIELDASLKIDSLMSCDLVFCASSLLCMGWSAVYDCGIP